MQLYQILYAALLILTTGYAAMFGGYAGKTGAAIFWAASVLTMIAGNAPPFWHSTVIGVMAVDMVCMLALAALALKSNRCWPIWALGFQIAAVATHFTTVLAPDYLPRAYFWLVGVWSLPILAAMVVGTGLDRIHDRQLRH